MLKWSCETRIDKETVNVESKNMKLPILLIGSMMSLLPWNAMAQGATNAPASHTSFLCADLRGGIHLVADSDGLIRSIGDVGKMNGLMAPDDVGMSRHHEVLGVESAKDPSGCPDIDRRDQNSHDWVAKRASIPVRDADVRTAASNQMIY
jgi:hypothetical protein